MSKPRIFISSTFYDLRQVRSDLDRFIKELGYESVLNELGNIPYGKEEKLEDYCYKEISNIDILVSIIGGRYGHQSENQNNSISQVEFKTALKLNKQIYIFIDKNVFSEYQTYLLNKNKSINYRFVDNVKIYEFIESCENLSNNNIISSFETSIDIIHFLKEQWAGLFQRFLQEQTRFKEINLLKGIENTAGTLEQLVNFLTEERKDKDTAIKDILLSNHPAMKQLQSLLKVSYRVYFTTRDEMTEWLSARSFYQDDLDFITSTDNFINFYKIVKKENKKFVLKIDPTIFNEEGKLKVISPSDWKKEFINLIEESNDPPIISADDLPF